MREIVRTNDPVLISAIEALLSGAQIPCLVLDQNMSVLEGSIGMLPRRILVADEQEAEARRNAAIADADARKAAAIAAAQADAEKARITGEAEKARRTALADAEAIEGARRGDAEKARRVAEADATRAEGEAQAAAILATGQAEAEAMEKKATAYGRYNEAAVLQMLVEVLPKVAKEVASPMAAIDQLTVLSTDGAAALPRQVADNLTQTLSMLRTTTGLDLGQLVQRFAGAATEQPGNGTVVPAPKAPSEG